MLHYYKLYWYVIRLPPSSLTRWCRGSQILKLILINLKCSSKVVNNVKRKEEMSDYKIFECVGWCSFSLSVIWRRWSRDCTLEVVTVSVAASIIYPSCLDSLISLDCIGSHEAHVQGVVECHQVIVWVDPPEGEVHLPGSQLLVFPVTWNIDFFLN